MFQSATAFNQDISNWNVERFTSMSSMFNNATAFNSPLNWGIKTTNVTNMSWMFSNARGFAQDISGWDVSNVISMNYMFYNSLLFEQDISNWNMSNVKTAELMFYGAIKMNIKYPKLNDNFDLFNWKHNFRNKPTKSAQNMLENNIKL